MALKCPTLCVIILLVWFADLSLSSTESDDNDQSLIVETTKAKIRGKRIDLQPHQLSAEHGRSVVAFTRIPYAEPPVGELRFARPVGKVVEGDFDATEPSIACMQATSPLWDIKMERSEDCLTVDVFVPAPKPKSAAVLLWIHGGGYHMGAGSIPLSTPVPLAAYGDVIVVTYNYRLGALGFLATGMDVKGKATEGENKNPMRGVDWYQCVWETSLQIFWVDFFCKMLLERNGNSGIHHAACTCGADEQTADHILYHCPDLQPPDGMTDLSRPKDAQVNWLTQLQEIA